MKQVKWLFLICVLGFVVNGYSAHIAPVPNIAQDTIIDTSQLLEVIEGQLVALRSGEVEKAYNDFTSAKFKKQMSLEHFKQFINKTPALSKNKTFQFHSQYFEDGIDSCQGALISTSGESYQVEYDLIQEEGKWKILGIQLFQPEISTPRQ